MISIGSNNVKYRRYTFVVYQEDITLSELVDKLRDSKMPCMVSPLHDKDKISDSDIEKYKKENSFDESVHVLGSLKKAHWHVIVELPYSKQFNSALNFINEGTHLDLKYIQGIGFFNLYCRYMCHLDDPGKQEYSQTQCVYVNNFVADFSKPSAPKSNRCIRRDLVIYINSNPSVSFTDVVNAFMEDDDVSDFIVKRSGFVIQLIKDVRFKNGCDSIGQCF